MITRQEIEERVKKLFIEELEFDAENISPDALLKEDIGVDSLDYVDIVVLVEREFGFRIKAEDMTSIKTFSQFCDYVESHLQE